MLICKRKVHTIVHPCFVKRLKTLRPKQKLDVISVVSHRYDNYHIVPSLAVNDLGYKTRLIGYDKNADTKRWVTSTCYNEVLDAENYMTFCEQLMESKIVVNNDYTVELWQSSFDYPPTLRRELQYADMTAVSPYNIKEMREMIKKVLNDEKFRQKVIDYAQNAVEYVSYESSKKKYLGALKEGSPSIQI